MTRLAPELERLQAARPQAARNTRTLVDDHEREALLAAITAGQHHERPGPDADHRRRRWLGRPAATYRGARPGVLAGSTLGLAGIGTTLALVLGATTTSPAFAVTRNHDGTVIISIQRHSGIAGANARLHQLGIRATVTQQPPAGCQPTVSIPMRGQGAPASEHTISKARWTIDPRKVPRDHTLALTPPPAGPPPAGNSGNSGSEGQVWSCGSEGPMPGSPPPAGNSGNSGNS